jgi:TonB family protein
MPKMRNASGFIALLSIALATGITPSAPTQETTPSTTTATDAPIIKHGKMDVRHPLHVGSAYYPKQSLKNHEQGKCTLAFFIEPNGSVPALQLLKSSGYPRLDIACIESVIDVPMLPATVNGTPFSSWSDFYVAWVIDHPQPYQPPPERSAFPRVANDYEFQAGEKYYPEAARAKRERGYCVVHTTVSSTGTALKPAIIRSTGSAILDKACLAAVTDARFTPELQNGQPVPDSTDIAIYW